MKKLTLLSLLFIFYLALNAQEISIVKKTKLDINHPAFFPSFGNTSNQLLYTGENSKGLFVYNLVDLNEVFVTDAQGAIQNARITSEGDIKYSEVQFVNRRRKIVENKYIFKTAKSIPIETVDFPDLEAQSSGKSIKIIKQGVESSTIYPMGDFYYLWVSVSPDKSKILFTVAGKGSYISDLNGENLQELGYLNAPVWINNNWIVGMNDKDNGEVVITSDIITVHIKSKKRYNLTGNDASIAQYPVVDAHGNKIAYHTLQGDIYILDIAFND